MNDLIDNDLIEELEEGEDCFVIFEREERSNAGKSLDCSNVMPRKLLRTHRVRKARVITP